MHFELPDCRRCCACIPLRCGILTFGYLNLVFSAFVIAVGAIHSQGAKITVQTFFLYRGVNMYTHMWFPYLLYGLEILFNIVLLVGVHRKEIRLMRIYYYYGIVTTLAAFTTFIVLHRFNRFNQWYFDFVDFFVAFSGLVLQCYLLLLVRSEINKPRYQEGQHRYVNHMSEVVADPLPPGDGRNPF